MRHVSWACENSRTITFDSNYGGGPFFFTALTSELGATAELPLRLWYELPILHILAVVEEVFALRGTGGEPAYQPMPQEEMRTLYPR